MNEEWNPDRPTSFFAIIREAASSSVLLFWRVWWKSFVACAALMIFLYIGDYFGDLPSDTIHFMIGFGFCLCVAAIAAAILGLFAVAWKYLGLKTFIPPIGAFFGALFGALLGALLIFAVGSWMAGDEFFGPDTGGGGNAVVLLSLVLIKFFAFGGAILGGLAGVLLVSFLVLRKRRLDRHSDS